ncbi:Nucleoid occlusion factor SlmA [Chryseobacterium aquaeductus]|uniref:Nucleoid occlusion factor SlmA n=1 Tax=Chryseobacterium aquaeductus TaxID=2675056 RepID=A0A9N8QV03_9FLAO|nr:TetR/AcrR family transcriptional regulator [Chryseobacterium aquaeductus]CAA7331393.1 Nucleoid occlusion factor SlmA [Chryseobacterium potabilaquae]CAD7809935.1 Nucleoid occlusion factor SlmA [Chryseobacterium aquaeductus]
MEFQLKFKVNQNLFLRDPENSEIGKSIVKNSIDLIFEMGFENFTFKKLAQKISSTEATIYRYFSSKHKLLTYILNWYWSYLELISKFRLSEIKDSQEKIEKLLNIITHQENYENAIEDYDLSKLHAIVIAESSKSYLVKEVDEINKDLVFNPLKSLCNFFGEVISEAKPDFPYPLSFASTLLETAHNQQFFSEHLPKLTDNHLDKMEHKKYVLEYLRYITFSLIK